MPVRVIGGTIPTCFYTDTKVSTASAVTHNISCAIGAVPVRANKRLVVVSVYAGGTVSSVTIGGVAATAAALHASNNPGIWYAAVLTGTTATVTVVLGFSASPVTVNVWAIYDITSNAPRFAVSSIASPSILNINCPARGIVIAMASTLTSGASYTWSGATPDNTNTSGINNIPRSVTHIVSAAGGSPLALSCSFSTASTPRGLAASWR